LYDLKNYALVSVVKQWEICNPERLGPRAAQPKIKLGHYRRPAVERSGGMGHHHRCRTIPAARLGSLVNHPFQLGSGDTWRRLGFDDGDRPIADA
jgi:hypothetical protein